MNGRVKISAKAPQAKRENKDSQVEKVGFAQSMSSPVDRILTFQKTIGNQAVQRLIKSGALRAKLRIGKPNDIYEQEADRVTEHVMRMIDVSRHKSIRVQRKCAWCEEELHRQVSGTPGLDQEQEARIEAPQNGGQPLPESVRSFFEPRFGYDFSDVRVHTDTKAAESAQAIDALAYTAGRNVVFGEGQYAPETTSGKRLLAHELTHVVQQGNAFARKREIEVMKTPPMVQGLWPEIVGGAIGGVVGGVGGFFLGGPWGAVAGAALGAAAGAAIGHVLAKKTVTVNVTYLKGGSTDLATHLSKANDVYKQANVEVKSGKSETLDEAKSKAILGDDLILNEYTDPSSPTAEEQALLKVNRTPGTITMYYVKGLSMGSIGEAFWPSAGQPGSFVYASTNTRTWPHELGHVLLDDGSHPSDADNFMAQTSVATGKELMTKDQISKIRSSTFVK